MEEVAARLKRVLTGHHVAVYPTVGQIASRRDDLKHKNLQHPAFAIVGHVGSGDGIHRDNNIALLVSKVERKPGSSAPSPITRDEADRIVKQLRKLDCTLADHGLTLAYSTHVGGSVILLSLSRNGLLGWLGRRNKLVKLLQSQFSAKKRTSGAL